MEVVQIEGVEHFRGHDGGFGELDALDCLPDGRVQSLAVLKGMFASLQNDGVGVFVGFEAVADETGEDRKGGP